MNANDHDRCACVCIPILVTTFPEWLRGTEPLPHTPVPCVRPRSVCSVLRAHVQFCRFDKADATADVQWHCNHRPPLWYHYFPAQSSLGVDILVYWIGKMVRTCAPGGSRTFDFLRARRAPYPLGQAVCSDHDRHTQGIFYILMHGFWLYYK